MTDKKFLALLNLYLDGEIDPVGVADLEREILSNPARRRTYSDYCRIHRGTKLVYEQFRTAAAAEGAPGVSATREPMRASAAGDYPAMPGRTGGRAAPRPFRTAIVLAGCAAAACAAVLFVATTARAPQAPESIAATPVAAPAEQPAPQVAVSDTPTTEQPASFTAPFAPERRADPYFVEVPETRPSPFSLTSWTEGMVQPNFAPAAFSDIPRLQIDSRFIPATEGEPGDVTTQRQPRFFRDREEDVPAAPAPPAAVSPIGLEIKR